MGLNESLEQLQTRFNELCIEQESLPQTGFASVFEVLDEIDEAFTPEHPYTDNEDNINKALEMAGHSNDEAFCRSFKRSNQITIEGKKIEAQIIPLMCKIFDSNQQETKPEGWQFKNNPVIIAPQELHQIINDRIQSDALKGEGLFSNITEIETFDETFDEYLDCEAYGVKCSLQPYMRALEEYGVIKSLFSSEELSFKHVLEILNGEQGIITYIKEHSTEPNKIRNYTTMIIKAFDDVPIWGLFYQITILQGLCYWCQEARNKIGESNDGYKDILELWGWIESLLIEKEILFTYQPWGDRDKERLKPLCDYLYSTELGQSIQEEIFGKHQTDIPEPQPLPSEGSPRQKSSTKGRPRTTLQDKITATNKEELINKLHLLIDGKSGKDVALVITACVLKGLMTKPTFKQVECEFGNIGNRSGFNKYMSKSTFFTDDELNGIKNQLPDM